MKKLLRVLKKIVDILGYVVMFVLIGMTVFVLVTGSKGEIPFFGDYGVVWVMTESMETAIPERSNILISKVDPAELEVGDVIVFISHDPAIQGQRNTHRIVEIIGNNEEFVTKGDHNPVPDEYHVFPEDVVGRYVRNLPFVTRFTRLLSNRMGLMMIVVLVMAVIMLIYMPDLKRSLKKQEEEAAAEREKFIEEMIQKEVEKMSSMNLVIPGLNDVAPQKQPVAEAEPEAEPADAEPEPVEPEIEPEPEPETDAEPEPVEHETASIMAETDEPEEPVKTGEEA